MEKQGNRDDMEVKSSLAELKVAPVGSELMVDGGPSWGLLAVART